MSIEAFASGGHQITCPTFDKRGRLLVASSGSGEVHQVVMEGASTAMQTVFNTGGSPSSLCIDVEGTIYVGDLAHQAVFRHGDDGQLGEFVKEYEGKQFKGPSAMLLDSIGNMFFCDSGPFGETTLQDPKGSIFLISADGQLLQPLVLESLAHPCALALGLDERVIFVAEQMQNRVLRLVQRPTGVYHCSVFYQFSGYLGPSGIARDPQAREISCPLPLCLSAPRSSTLAPRRTAGQPLRDPVRLRQRGSPEAGVRFSPLSRGHARAGHRHPRARAHGHHDKPAAECVLRHGGLDQHHLSDPSQRVT